MSPTRITLLLAGALLLALIASACDSGGATPAPSPSGAAASTGSAPAATAAPAATTSGGSSGGSSSGGSSGGAAAPTIPALRITPGALATTAAELRETKNVTEGLAKLKSYRARIAIAFDGKDKTGQPQKGTANVVQEVVNATNDFHLKFDQSGNPFGAAGTPVPGTPNAVEMYRVGGNTFMITGGGCQFFSSGDTSAIVRGMISVDQLVGSNKATLVKRGEQVNGVTADHYMVNEASLTSDLDGMKLDKGDVWISPDNYVVKMVLQASGTNSKGSTGADTINYDVDNINTQAVTLPPTCVVPTQSTDIPFPANITEKRTIDAGGQSVTTFKSPDPSKTVADFYRSSMVAQGWKLDSEQSSNPVAISMNFSKDSGKRTVSINIVNAGQGTSVIISEKKP